MSLAFTVNVVIEKAIEKPFYLARHLRKKTEKEIKYCTER